MPYAHRVNGKVDLRNIDSNVDGGLSKEKGVAKSLELGAELDKLQELLYAAGTHGLLVVLQGRDTAGKDGTLRGLSRFVDIQGVKVASFKVPTPEELSGGSGLPIVPCPGSGVAVDGVGGAPCGWATGGVVGEGRESAGWPGRNVPWETEPDVEPEERPCAPAKPAAQRARAESSAGTARVGRDDATGASMRVR